MANIPAKPIFRESIPTLFIMLLALLWAGWSLQLDPADLIPESSYLVVAKNFFTRAFLPALNYEDPTVPIGTEPLLVKALRAAGMTVVLAAAAISLAIPFGLFLGFFCSQSWWKSLPHGNSKARVVRGICFSIYLLFKSFSATIRSVHELLWAVLFLSAFGVSQLSAVLAITIPYGGMLARVFSELLDEAVQGPADALRATGASPLQTFLFGLFPVALPDLCSYTLFRFECGLRSSAILGFFGYPTLGYFISASFENLYYGEVWTYLYTMFGLVLLTDWCSKQLRQRLHY